MSEEINLYDQNGKIIFFTNPPEKASNEDIKSLFVIPTLSFGFLFGVLLCISYIIPENKELFTFIFQLCYIVIALSIIVLIFFVIKLPLHRFLMKFFKTFLWLSGNLSGSQEIDIHENTGFS